eukprot:gene4804-5156_t
MSCQHRLFHQDFFYHALISYLELIEVVEYKLLNKIFYNTCNPIIKRWMKYWIGGLPNREYYNQLVTWEKERGLMVPGNIRCFYASWREQQPIFQRQLTVHPAMHPIPGRIRHLYDYSSKYLSQFSTSNYLCLACTMIRSVHKDWEVYLVTFLDLLGEKTGSKGSIFDIEYVSHWDSSDPITEIQSRIEVELVGEFTYEGHAYYSYGLGMTARNFFELLDMMKENRFYHYNEPSTRLVYWRRGSGGKSFLEQPNQLLSFPDETLNELDEESDEYYQFIVG